MNKSDHDLSAPEVWARSLARSRRRRLGDRPQPEDPVVGAPGRPARPPARDLGCHELWELSLLRSQARRRAAAQRSALDAPRAAVSLALAAAVAPTLAGLAGAPLASAHRTGAAAAGASLLKHGSRGPAVAALQRALGIPADGIFGAQTRRAVRSYQRSHDLVVDGVAGPQTLAALGPSGNDRLAATGPSTSARGDWVRQVQRVLGVAVDGVYGPATRAAVRRWQRSHGLTADGVVGPRTRAAMGIAGGSGSTSPGTDAAPAPQSSGAGAAVAAARSQVGKPYAYGGNGPGAFDCSGLTVYAFRQAGISLPRTSYGQYGMGRPVSRSVIQAGDLVFFNTNGPGASHVGVATGPSSFVSATSHGVREQPIGGSYWGSHYVGARRLA